MSTGVLRGHEGSPLVIGDTMYVHTPFPNNVYAVNLKDQSFKWKYEPKQNTDVVPVMCCDTVNRGLAYRRRQDPAATGRHDAGRAGRQHRQGRLDRQERRSEDRRDEHECAARLQRQGDHRYLRRRVRRARTRDRVRPQDRQESVDGLEHRARQRVAGRSRQDDDLDQRQARAGRRRLLDQDLEGRSVEARRRHDLGLVLLRSRS